MKTLKIPLILVFFLSLIACKKETNELPQPSEEPFDITQYVIVGLAKPNRFSAIHYIQTFEAQAQGKSIEYNALFVAGETGNYTFNDGILKIFDRSGQLDKEFKIENKEIVSSTNAEYYTHKLVKIPPTNQLNGNVFSGGWTKFESTITSLVKLKFTNTHYVEGTFNLPDPNTEYQIIKNIGAVSFQPGKSTFWVLVDGKLEGIRLNSGVYRGAFIKQ